MVSLKLLYKSNLSQTIYVYHPSGVSRSGYGQIKYKLKPVLWTVTRLTIEVDEQEYQTRMQHIQRAQ
jgi:hypothetical protein